VSIVRSAPRLATLAVVATAACVYDARVPSEPAAARAPAFAVQAATRGGPGQNVRHIVSFRGQIPADFATQVARLGGQVLWTSSGTRLAVVRGLSSASAASLAGNQSVEEVDQDDLLQLEKPTLSAVNAGGAVGPQSADNPAGAVRFARQWNMRAVQADAAWAGGFLGSPNVSIFMLDTGIDYLHSDLVGRVDLDRSIDLLGTFDAPAVVGNDTVIVPFTEADTVAKYFPDRLPITDLFFHGTHTGATVSSNAVRTAGVTSKTKLVAVKVCGYIDLCPFSSILGGVLYGAANGADVMNLSLGGAFLKKGNKAFIQLIARVFEFAHSQGVTIVVSAGNAAFNLDTHGNIYFSFCDTPGVICVAATGPTADATGLTTATGPWANVDAHAFYSNFGRKAIDVAAPGGNSSFGPNLPAPASRAVFVWAPCSQTAIFIDPTTGAKFFPCATLPIFIIGAQGTSMSAPHVTGTAALLVSILGRNPDAIKERIDESADQVGGVQVRGFYGNGRLNVARAVGAIP